MKSAGQMFCRVLKAATDINPPLTVVVTVFALLAVFNEAVRAELQILLLERHRVVAAGYCCCLKRLSVMVLLKVFLYNSDIQTIPKDHVAATNHKHSHRKKSKELKNTSFTRNMKKHDSGTHGWREVVAVGAWRTWPSIPTLAGWVPGVPEDKKLKQQHRKQNYNRTNKSTGQEMFLKSRSELICPAGVGAALMVNSCVPEPCE